MKPLPLKLLAIFVTCLVCHLCFAAGDTNIIAMSEWSKSVPLQNDQGHDVDIHGRLVIVRGTEPAYGGPPTTGTMTFVELKDTTGASGEATKIYFAVTNLHCQLVDATGNPAPKEGGPGSGRGPFSPCWLTLPYNSTIRLYVNGGTREPLMLYPSGEPWSYWSIPKSDTNTYYLSGTLTIFTHINSPGPGHKGTLVFPKMKIPRGDAEPIR